MAPFGQISRYTRSYRADPRGIIERQVVGVAEGVVQVVGVAEGVVQRTLKNPGDPANIPAPIRSQTFVSPAPIIDVEPEPELTEPPDEQSCFFTAAGYAGHEAVRLTRRNGGRVLSNYAVQLGAS